MKILAAVALSFFAMTATAMACKGHEQATKTEQKQGVKAAKTGNGKQQNERKASAPAQQPS